MEDSYGMKWKERNILVIDVQRRSLRIYLQVSSLWKLLLATVTRYHPVQICSAVEVGN